MQPIRRVDKAHPPAGPQRTGGGRTDARTMNGGKRKENNANWKNEQKRKKERKKRNGAGKKNAILYYKLSRSNVLGLNDKPYQASTPL